MEISMKNQNHINMDYLIIYKNHLLEYIRIYNVKKRLPEKLYVYCEIITKTDCSNLKQTK